jgi:hypothetical protein
MKLRTDLFTHRPLLWVELSSAGENPVFLLEASSLCFSSFSFFLPLFIAGSSPLAGAGQSTWLNLLSVQPCGVHLIVSKSRGARGDHTLKRAIKSPGVGSVPLRSQIVGGKSYSFPHWLRSWAGV